MGRHNVAMTTINKTLTFQKYLDYCLSCRCEKLIRAVASIQLMFGCAELMGQYLGALKCHLLFNHIIDSHRIRKGETICGVALCLVYLTCQAGPEAKRWFNHIRPAPATWSITPSKTWWPLASALKSRYKPSRMARLVCERLLL